MKFTINILTSLLLCFALFFSQGLGLEKVLANTSTPQSLLLQALEAAQANKPDEALMLGQQAAQLAQEHGDKALEARIRGAFVEFLRPLRINNHLILYREQLERLEFLHSIEDPPVTEPKIWLHLLRAELALGLDQLTEAIFHAQKAKVGAEELQNHELLRTAQLLEGVALSHKVLGELPSDSLLGFLPGHKQGSLLRFTRTKQLLTSALQDSIFTPFKYLELQGHSALFFIAVREGQLELAQQIFDRFPESSAMAPTEQAERLYDLASLKLAANEWEEGRELIKQANLIVKTETNEQWKSQTYLDRAIPYSLLFGQYEDAKEFFSWIIMFLQGTPEGLHLIIKSLHDNIIPALESRNLSQLGAEFLEEVLAIPAISDSPEMSYKLYPVLGRFYAEVMDGKRLEALYKRASKQHASYPAHDVLQSLKFSVAIYYKTKDVKLTRGFYRAAIQHSLLVAEKDFWTYFFHALREAMTLALDVGQYQDVVDFALLGLVPLHYEFIEESEAETEAAIWFLVDAADALLKVARVDLADDAIGLAIGRQDRSPSGWRNRIALNTANYFALLGDYESAQGNLAIGLKDPSFRGRGLEDKAAKYWLLMAQVQDELGDYFRAEKRLRDCINVSTNIFIQPAVEGECRIRLSWILSKITREFDQAGQEWDQGLEGLLIGKKILWYLESFADNGQNSLYKENQDLDDLRSVVSLAKKALSSLNEHFRYSSESSHPRPFSFAATIRPKTPG